MITTAKTGKTRKISAKSITKKATIKQQKSIAQLFGANKKEVDGLQFQKKVRNEWQ